MRCRRQRHPVSWSDAGLRGYRRQHVQHEHGFAEVQDNGGDQSHHLPEYIWSVEQS